MEQNKTPMDYVEELAEYDSFEDALAGEYAKMSFFEKVVYHLQNHVLKMLSSSFVLGYLVGKYVDESWIFSLLNTLNIQ